MDMDKICMFETCERPVDRIPSSGLCNAHYHQKRAGKELKPLVFWEYKKGTPCTIEDCHEPSKAMGLCGAHYERKRDGRSMEGKIERRDAEVYIKNGLKYFKDRRDGYVYRFRTRQEKIDGYPYRILEHREVMEGILGRRLLGKENVHHLNGIKDDNSENNVELWTRHQPSGQRVEDKIKWAKEFLAEYGYTVTAPNLLN